MHLITDIIPWEVKIDATGDEPLMTELRFRGVAFSGRDVFRKKSSFALTVDCLGGKPFQAQWFHRLAVACNGGIPTRLTCVLKYFMKYIGWIPRCDGRSQTDAAERIAFLLEYFGVKPDHLHNSQRCRSHQSSTSGYIKDDATEEEYYSVTVVAMLLCICKFFHSAHEGGDGHDAENDKACLELLRGLLMWPLQSTPT